MAKTQEKVETITVDIKPFIMPITMIICSLIIGLSFMGGMLILRNGKGTSNTNNRVGTGEVEVDPGEELTVNNLAEAIDGIDLEEFQACVEANDTTEIEADLADGTDDGISGTPGFIIGTNDGDGNINGVFVNGAQPYSTFEEVINAFVDGKQSTLDSTTYPAASTSVDDDPFLGNEDEAIVVVEFSDYECPFCQRHHNETYPEIISNFVDNGKAKYVFRDYPLSFHEPKASEAAVAANCIFAQGGSVAYFQFSDLYYENTKSNGEGL